MAAPSPLSNCSGVMSFSITCDGVSMPETAKVISIETDHGVNRIPRALITLVDGDMPSGDFPLADAGHFKPGTEIVINAGYVGESKDDVQHMVFTGVVIKHSVKIDGDNESRLMIECAHKALAMTIGRKNATYIDRKDSEIIADLIGNYRGLSASVDATTFTHKTLLQYYTSDWDYLLNRAELNGLWVTFNANQLCVNAPNPKASPVLTLTYGDSLIEFEASLDACSQVEAITSTSWDPATQQVVQATARPAELTKQGDIAAAALAQVLNIGTLGLQTAAALDPDVLKAWSNAEQTKAALSRIYGRMKFHGSAAAKPGVVLTLKGVGKHFNGNVIATRVRHRLANGEWHTDVEFGMSSDVVPEAHAARVRNVGAGAGAISGLHIGVVTMLDTDPQGQCRIQVAIPLMNAQPGGVWARLANFYASSGYGAFIVPEIGDEVVLGFFNNDPSCPVVLGSLYSSKHAPPYAPTAQNDVKALVTRSKLKMEFDDGKKIITLITPANNKVVIDDHNASILLEDQHGNKVALGASGISLESSKDISIKAQGNVTFSATRNVEIAALGDVNTTALNINSAANASLVAKAAVNAELSAGAQTTIKAALVAIN
jgi:Rhs element Vgr protein